MAENVCNPSSLVVNGVEVSTANPLPATSVAAGPSNPSVSISPRTWVVNGAPVSTSNPLPITLV